MEDQDFSKSHSAGHCKRRVDDARGRYPKQEEDLFYGSDAGELADRIGNSCSPG